VKEELMDTQKYLIAVLVVFVAHSAVGYMVHDVLLSADYKDLDFVREFNDFVRRLPLLYLANLLFAMVLCFIYTRGYDPERNWFPQGLVFGLLMSAFLLPAALVAYVAVPLPLLLTLKVAGLNVGHVTISALVGAALYRLPPPNLAMPPGMPPGMPQKIEAEPPATEPLPPSDE
jgi:hypothetical protein